MAEAVRLDSLTYRYPGGALALDSVSCAIREGETVALLGTNGAGKSTLLLHLNGIHTADGAVRIFGMEVRPGNLRMVRRRVGIVFQNPDDQLFSTTLFDDVAFGPRNMGLPEEEVERRVREGLEAVGLWKMKDRNPFHLSFGQKKRGAVATVLSMRPDIMALDEPTSNLDPRARREVIRMLKAVGKTLIVATHDLPLARELCGRSIILSEGKIVGDGPSAEILSDTRLLAESGLA